MPNNNESMPEYSLSFDVPEFAKIHQEFISKVKSPFKVIEEQNRYLNEFINQITGPFKEFVEQLPAPLTDKINKIAHYTKELQLENIQISEDLLIEFHNAKQFPQEDTLKNLPKYKQVDYLLKWLGCIASLLLSFLTSGNAEININTKTTNIQEQNNITVNRIEQCDHAEILDLIIDVREELEALKEQELLAAEKPKNQQKLL